MKNKLTEKPVDLKKFNIKTIYFTCIVKYAYRNGRFIDILRFKIFEGLVHPKMKILSVFTHPHVVPTP